MPTKRAGVASLKAGKITYLLTSLCVLPLLLAATTATASSIYSQCWSDPWPKPWLDGISQNFAPKNFGNQPVKLKIWNPSNAYLEICIYDRVCRQHVYSGSLHPKAFVRLRVCSDDRRRGSIWVMDRAGKVLPYEDLQSRTVKLPVIGQ